MSASAQPPEANLPAAAVAPSETVTQPAATVLSGGQEEGHLLRHANWYTTGLFGLSVMIWLFCMPWRGSKIYDLPLETDLCTRILQAETNASPGTSGEPAVLPAGCPKLTVMPPGKGERSAGQQPVGWTYLRRISVSDPASASAESLEDLKTDLTVWTRYEYEFKTFEWGRDLNWYLYSTLKVLVIILSALTPALIVAPIFQKKKFIAALPAAIVAVATGCISEFDFKDEAAAYTIASVNLQGEKTAFITRSRPWYDFTITHAAASGAEADKTQGGPAGANSPRGVENTSQTAATAPCDNVDVPYATPLTYSDVRANFSCRIQTVWQTQSQQRVLFLRGGPSQAVQEGNTPAGGAPPPTQQQKPPPKPAG
jgi:hypothetical protein